MTSNDRIMVLTDLLLGAVHADGTVEGSEEAAVRKLLGELHGGKLPDAVDARIKGFDAKGFDLTAAARDFAADAPVKKRRLLELVAAVRDADDVIDLAEDDYMVRLATALGMQKSEYGDLTLEIEELREAFEDVRKPPPLPKA